MLPLLVLAPLVALSLALPSTPDELSLWPDGVPPGAASLDAARAQQLRQESDLERIRLVETPTLTVLHPEPDARTGRAVVVCPGGGYNLLAWRKEGLEVAEWLSSIGVTAVVLKYRVPRRGPAIHVEPLQDAQRALRLVRHKAEAWGVDPEKVGILGFSAGGHLAVMAGTHWDRPAYEPRDEVDALSCRPDFLVPVYAAYRADGYRDDVAERGQLVRVTRETPPMFLAVTADDKLRGAQAALLFVRLCEVGVRSELHVYSRGGHGYGIRPSANPVATWHQRCADWLGTLD